MDEQLLKMNGLLVGILDTLSFEPHLGILLKKNLLIAELIEMTEWLAEQEILSSIVLEYRVKSLDSILMKYDRYYPNHQTRKVFNDFWIFGIFVIVMTRYWTEHLRSSELLICQMEKRWMTDTEVFMCIIKKVENIIL